MPHAQGDSAMPHAQARGPMAPTCARGGWPAARATTGTAYAIMWAVTTWAITTDSAATWASSAISAVIRRLLVGYSWAARGLHAGYHERRASMLPLLGWLQLVVILLMQLRGQQHALPATLLHCWLALPDTTMCATTLVCWRGVPSGPPRQRHANAQVQGPKAPTCARGGWPTEDCAHPQCDCVHPQRLAEDARPPDAMP